MSKQSNLSQLKRLLDLQDLTLKQSGRWLTNQLSHATKHHLDKEELVFKVFKSSVTILFLIKRSPSFKNRILSMLGSLPKSKWTTFLDNLNTSTNHNLLAIQLLQILLQELTSRGKDCQPFWKPVYKDVSERLLLPIGTDFVDLATNSSSNWSQRLEEKSQFLTIKTTKQVNKNLQKTFSPSLMSSLADKWEKEVTQPAKVKTLRIRVHPTKEQRRLLDEFIDTSRYVYNKTLYQINKGHKINFQSLRDLLVTANTKKNLDEYKAFDERLENLRKQKKQAVEDDKKASIQQLINNLQQERRDKMKNCTAEKNDVIQPFEVNTPKDVRSNAVEQCCNAFKSGFTNLKKGNIKHFRLGFKKKAEKRQTIELTPKNISIVDGRFKILPDKFKEDCFLETSKNSKKRLQGLKVENNVDIVREKGCYYVHLCVKTKVTEPKTKNVVVGVDFGVRTFATVHLHNLKTNEDILIEYKHRHDVLIKLNKKIDTLKKTRDGRIRKIAFTKIEARKANLVNLLHWNFINDILSRSDVIYLGDIKSHDIVNGGKNKTLNRALNDLKFFQLKQRLMYKAGINSKKVILVKEHYTTKTCSTCGQLNHNVGSKEVFTCRNCGLITGRDMNASKNMVMKGLLL